MGRGIKSNIDEKIKDQFLQKHLTEFASTYKQKKNKAFEKLDFKKLQKELGKMKSEQIEKNDVLFSIFKEKAEKAGSIIYEARNGKDAVAYITNICKAHNAEYVIKSKSMTAEEIHLNTFLENNGITPVESDLGEWIIQLCKEKPSHMVIPAIHKNKKQVATVLSKISKQYIDENDTALMVKTARELLRGYYFKSKVGITGANIAIAKTGTIAIVTNEGNARLTTTIPPVHIVILGYEKLVYDFKNAMQIIRMLPKSTTGQNISSYVTFIRGLNESLNNSMGIKEQHIIFLDNGRLSFMKHHILKDAFKCIRCGSCANVCPVYEIVGGHIFGNVYVGPIGLILTALYHSEKSALTLFELCIGCRACSENCPADIDLQELISILNLYLSKKYNKDYIMKFGNSLVLTKPRVQKSLFKFANFASKVFLKNKKVNPYENLPIVNKDFRILPTIKEKTFSEIYKSKGLNKSYKKEVFFYPGCAIEYIYPKIGVALVELFSKIGIPLEIPNETVCCGMPLIHSGDFDNANKIVRKLIKSLGFPQTYKYYITLCPSCSLAFVKEIEKFVFNDPELYKYVFWLKHHTKSLNTFLEEEKISINMNNNYKVTYHTPCHLKRGLNTSSEKLLSNILNNNFISLEDSEVCCGFGGSFSFIYNSLSSSIAEKKIKNITKTDAEMLITDCPGCIMQLSGALKKKNINIETMHLSEFLNTYYL
jgi:iron-sulfur cluster protein